MVGVSRSARVAEGSVRERVAKRGEGAIVNTLTQRERGRRERGVMVCYVYASRGSGREERSPADRLLPADAKLQSNKHNKLCPKQLVVAQSVRVVWRDGMCACVSA